MDDSKKVRQSNFELMRILSMLMIVMWHALRGDNHGNVINNCGRESLKLIFESMMFIMVVHVNSYVLLSGYFQVKNKFKMSKLLRNIDMVWFYRVAIMIFLIVINVWHPTHIEIFRNIFPIDMGFYWFMDVYILLYCISPFLNKYIEKSNQKELKKIIIVLFILFSVIPYITGLKAFYNDGYCLYNFILLYFIGAYLRKYPIQESYIFKNITKNLFQIICVFIFFVCALCNFLLARFANSITSFSNILNEIGNNLNIFSLLYSNPIVIIQTVAYFCFFETLNFKNKFINKVSSLTLGVYLIHNNIQIRHHIYKWLKIDNGVIYSYKFIPYVLLMVLLIYVVCSIIEWIRQVIFKFIYERKLSKKWRKKYRNYINNCGIKINW